MSIKKKLQSGFTLVELMIVVAIIGILAVLAIYGVKKYIANSKTAEARQSLGRLAKDAAASYEGERMDPTIKNEGTSTEVTRELCDTATATVPATIGDVAGKKYQSSALEWKVDQGTAAARPKGFACLRFEINTPQYYMYQYTRTATGTAAEMEATAWGDLDGNNTKSEFTLKGKVQSARLTLAPQLIEVNPEE